MSVIRQYILVCMLCYPLFATSTSNMVLEQKVAEHSEQIDGLRSIVDGLNEKLNQLTRTNETLMQEADANKELLFELRERIDKINQNYVTKDEFTKKSKQSIVAPANNIVKTDSISTKKKKTKEEYYKDGLTQYKLKNYEEAKINFKQSAILKYNDALSYYYLGECAYYLKSYNEAVGYYKKSVGINDNATYMDVLLLHTAVSLENTKEIKQAKLFYEMVIEKYPSSNSATIAKKKLTILK